MSTEKRRSVFIHIVFCVTIIFCSYVFVFSRRLVNLDGDFDAYIFGSNLSGVHSALKYGELRLWNPNFWGGISGIHNFSGIFYPPSIIIASFFRNMDSLPLEAFGIYEFFHVVIGGLGFYALLNNLGFTKDVSFASVIGGDALLYFLDTCIGIYYFPQLNWIPVILCMLLLSMKSNKVINVYNAFSSLFIGLFLMQQLAQGAVLGLCILGLSMIVSILSTVTVRKGALIPNILELVKVFLQFALPIGLGVMMSAVYLLPILAQNKNQMRYTIDYGMIYVRDKMPVSEYYKDMGGIETLQQYLGARTGYSHILLGMAILLVLGLFSKEFENQYKKIFHSFFSTIYVLVLFSETGVLVPEIYNILPAVSMIRELRIYECAMPIAITGLMAFGIEALIRIIINRNTDSISCKPLCLCLVLGIMICSFTKSQYNIRVLMSLIGLILIIIAVVLGEKISNVKFKSIMISIAVCLFGASSFIIHYGLVSDDSRMTITEASEKFERVKSEYSSLFDVLDEKADNTIYRIDWLGETALSLDSSVDIGRYYVPGYWEPIYDKVLRLYWNIQDSSKKSLLYATKYVLIKKDPEGNWEEYVKQLNENGFSYYTEKKLHDSFNEGEPNDVLIYSNDNYKGLGWMTYDYCLYDDNENIFEQMNSTNVDLSKVAFLNTSDDEIENYNIVKNGDKEHQYKIEVDNYSNNRIELTCETDAAGIMVLAECYTPGWEAYVDGKKTNIIEADYSRRALPIPKGEHVITLEYKPMVMILGAWISLASMTVVIAIIIINLVNDRKKRAVIIDESIRS
ncbi:YfhO family protein [Butyrivibrio sp. WCD2001]|uniref:YfhO family protein n=1 Tax=Butyrivibrio sp. WCD2001 TaxID=1280681 RepID=UPI00041C3362|nr:YfhO family protein [Butyrivibrio sp. WCD2001]